jgi:hypothetical protein
MIVKRVVRIFLLVFCLVGFSASAFAQSSNSEPIDEAILNKIRAVTLARSQPSKNVSTDLGKEQLFPLGSVDQTILNRVKAVLDVPEDKIDFTYSKLTLDKMVDPSIDVDRETERIDQMAQAILAMGSFENSGAKAWALKRFLYEAGEWNQFHTFAYDFHDPRGEKMENRLLPSYMNSRRGNCVSMPSLFVVLAQKLGLDVSLSTAPGHFFVKLTLDDGTINIEPTSDGKKSSMIFLICQSATVSICKSSLGRKRLPHRLKYCSIITNAKGNSDNLLRLLI